tara:strand:+ start:335 stop:1258 length:924 start_codon:yes stop_codon:yes gene_type:complete
MFVKKLFFLDKQKKFFFYALSAFIFTYFLLNNHKNFHSLYKLIKSNSYSTFGRIKNYKNSCKIPLIQEFPDNSIAVIGHAYGSPLKSNIQNNNNNFLAPKVERFLKNNQSKINTVIFTGDVFMIPSSTKWIKLMHLYSQKFNILIAPGNHDLVGSKNRYAQEIFSKFIKDLDSYPFTSNSLFFNFIIENSNNNMNMDEFKLFELIDSFDNSIRSKTILFRHHIPIKELKYLSNRRKVKDIPTFRDFERKIKNHDLIIISGDGGAFDYLQRIGCLQFNSIKYIVNGIGEVDGDRIIIINKGNIYQMKV